MQTRVIGIIIAFAAILGGIGVFYFQHQSSAPLPGASVNTVQNPQKTLNPALSAAVPSGHQKVLLEHLGMT